MNEELVKNLREAAKYDPCIIDRNDAIEAAKVIESLVQENSFLKLMQQQLTKDIPENELGIKVYNAFKMCGF